MYEHNGKLLVRTDRGYEIVTLKLNEDGSYTVTPTGKKYNSRPKGATRTTAKNVIVQHGLVAGDIYPAPEADPNAQPPQGQPQANGGANE